MIHGTCKELSMGSRKTRSWIYILAASLVYLGMTSREKFVEVVLANVLQTA